MRLTRESGIKLSLEEVQSLIILFKDALSTDGADHKQYYLCEIANKIGFNAYDFTDDCGVKP